MTHNPRTSLLPATPEIPPTMTPPTFMNATPSADPGSVVSVIALGRPAVPSVAGRTMMAIGTFCSVLVTRPAVIDQAQQMLAAELAAIDLACSRFRPDSELSALNRARGRQNAVSPLFGQALEVALRAAEITGGDVDPTCGRSLHSLGYDKDFGQLAADTSALAGPAVPAPGWRCVEFDADRLTVRVPAGVMLDLGATAKALAADLAATALAEALGCGVLVNLGGDIAVGGDSPEGGWRVGVQDGVTTPAPVVSIQAGGLATSSPGVRGWRRGDQAMHHIVAPNTGQPAEVYWAAVSVAGATCVDANTASTASVIRGRRAQAWLDELGLPARLARPDGMVVTTGGWPQ
jgi:thiamine biosynthesis lipoprotein